jgi:hypothetical protein
MAVAGSLSLWPTIPYPNPLTGQTICSTLATKRCPLAGGGSGQAVGCPLGDAPPRSRGHPDPLLCLHPCRLTRVDAPAPNPHRLVAREPAQRTTTTHSHCHPEHPVCHPEYIEGSPGAQRRHRPHLCPSVPGCDSCFCTSGDSITSAREGEGPVPSRWCAGPQAGRTQP